MKKHTIQIKVNKASTGLVEGQTYTVPCDNKGTPLDRIWRKRISNAVSDGAVEIVKPSKPSTQKKSVTAPSEGKSND